MLTDENVVDRAFSGGGDGAEDEEYQSDTWKWDGTGWTQRNVSGPGPRSMCSMAPL